MEFHLLILIICVVFKPSELKSVKQLKSIDDKTFKTINSSQNNDRRDDAVYAPNIISLNGRGAMPEAENMLKLRVPKAINIGDTIIINGAFEEDKKTFEIYLTEGMSEPDMTNVAFYLKVDFQANTLQLGSISEGNSVNESNYNTDKVEFKIEMGFRPANRVSCVFNEDSLDDVKYEIPMNNISFIVLNGDVSHVSNLSFTYSKNGF